MRISMNADLGGKRKMCCWIALANTHLEGLKQVKSGFSLYPIDFGVEVLAQVCDQGFNVSHLVLHREHRYTLGHAVVNQEVLPSRNHEKRRRPVLPQAAFFRVGGNNAHDGIQIGKVFIGYVIAPFTA